MKITQEQITQFPWGRVADVHSIGDYDIIEAHHRIDGKSHSFKTEPAFHPYVDGKDIGWSFPTLDEAIIGAMAYKHDGGNSRATEYISRILNITKP